MRRLLWLLALLPPCLASGADDAQLVALRARILPFRRPLTERSGPRGATPRLTTVKQQLRDWIETRLPAIQPSRGEDDEALAAYRINQSLRQAGLFCSCSPRDGEPKCADFTYSGYVDRVRILRRSGFLVVLTGVGIDGCGFDMSAYLYQWDDKTWRRRWESEQNTYTKDYAPQTIDDVLASAYNNDGEFLILTTGHTPWCTSVWRTLFLRVWRVRPFRATEKLLDHAELGNVGEDPPIRASVGQDDVRIEYATTSFDSGRLIRTCTRHYRLVGDELRRVDPVALRPREFVEEWTMRPWSEMARWTEKASLQAAHEAWRRTRDQAHRTFQYPALRCRSRDLWQVGVDEQGRPPTYFLIRWTPPYQFRLVDVASVPSLACTEEYRELSDHSQ